MDITFLVLRSPFSQELLVQARPAPCCLNSLDGGSGSVLRSISAIELALRRWRQQTVLRCTVAYVQTYTSTRNALMWRFGGQQHMQSILPP